MNLFRRVWHGIRRYKKTSIVSAIAAVLLIGGIVAMSGEPAPEVLTAQAVRGDLRQTVEAIGSVISERDLELRFAATGIVSQVLVKEGDTVRAGQRLAQLKAGSLGASIASQRAALESALADLRTLEQGTRPEDIAIAEADVESKRASLQVARQTLESAEQNINQSEQQLVALQDEARVNLAGEVSTSLSTLNEKLTSIENSLSTIEDVLSRTDVNDAMTKQQPQAPAEIRLRAKTAADNIVASRRIATAARDYSETIDAMSNGRIAAQTAGAAMDYLFSIISSLQETSSFTSSSRETIKSSIAAERSTIQDASGTIASALSSLQNASASYDTKIAGQQASIVTLRGTRDKAQADILTFEASVRSAEAQLQLKRAGARQTDIDAARARVAQQQALLARSQADFGDTVLTSPVTGTVTHVNIRIGESLPAGAAITVLGQSPYRVEMFVAEIDIPKVQRTQTGSIELDAFPGTDFALRVGDIDPAATDKDGVPKYRVRLDFVYPHDELKIGMTGDAVIVTGEKQDVVHVPRRAVIEDDDGRPVVRIQDEDGSIDERQVTMGMEGEDGDIEVISGVEEGETVIVLIK